jgi:AraC family L-rhamnose operon regulatory protein RhaS
MEFYTIGLSNYSGYIMDMCVSNNIESIYEAKARDYYKIIFFEAGTYHIILNNKEYILAGTYALCLNDIDTFLLRDKSEKPFIILYFKPSVINSKFTMDSLNRKEFLSDTELQDLYFISNFRYNAAISSKIIQLHTIDSSIVKQRLLNLMDLLTLQNNPNWPCYSRAYLIELLFSLVKPNGDSLYINQIQINSSYSKLTTEVIYYLQNYYNKKLTIDSLAQIFHTNRTTLLNDFKKSTGKSINRYLTQIRMTMAASLLRDTDLSINEICERTGFSDISYFSKSFKKEIQFTPSEYRRINVS